MIWNIALLLLVFSASKKKRNPYVAAGILGGVKAVLYFVGTRSVPVSILAGAIFCGLAAAMVYFLARIDKKAPSGPSYGTPGAKAKNSVAWEWYPLSLVVVLIVFGEMIVALIG